MAQDHPGIYYKNALLLKLGTMIRLIETGNTITFCSSQDHATFMHEYSHYLTNISTVAGIGEILYLHELLMLFAETLTQLGESKGESSLAIADQNLSRQIIQLISDLRGSEEPIDLAYESNLDFYRIVGVQKKKLTHSLNGAQLSLTRVELTIRGDCPSGIIDTHFLFGSTAIDEGLAYEFDQAIGGNTSPVFPYQVLRMLIEYYVKEVSSLEVCALASIALLSSDPAGTLITLLECYQSLDKTGREMEALKSLWNSVKGIFSDSAMRAIRDEFNALHDRIVGHGTMPYTIEFLRILCEGTLARRIEGCIPLLDLEIPLLSHRQEDLIHLLQQNCPCNAILKVNGQPKWMRFADYRLPIGGREFQASTLLAVLQCQVHYLEAHQINGRFVPSSIVPPTGCPFESVCQNERRANFAEICEQHPWHIYSRDDEPREKCPYGAAVAFLLGTEEFDIS